MTLCICDGPAHVWTADWCRAGRSASYPHGPIAMPVYWGYQNPPVMTWTVVPGE